jgi:hypothetical protein
MAKKDSKPVEARVLAAAVLCGVAVVPGQLVAASAEEIKGWADIGLLDAHPEAVAYAKGEGQEAVDLTAAAAAAEAAPVDPPQE